MAWNTIQFQKGLSLPKFLEKIGTEEACRQVLFELRWPEGFRSDSVDQWVRQHLSSDAEVTSDGLQCFRAIVETCLHWSIITRSSAASMQIQACTWVNTMLGNVKNSIHEKHLGRYPGEFAYRFNRRFELDRMIERLAYVACRTAPLPYRFAN